LDRVEGGGRRLWRSRGRRSRRRRRRRSRGRRSRRRRRRRRGRKGVHGGIWEEEKSGGRGGRDAVM